MANESVAHIQPVKQTAPCKYDTEMVDQVNDRVLKTQAIADLLMTVDAQQLSKNTVSTVSWLMIELLDEVKAIVNEAEGAAA